MESHLEPALQRLDELAQLEPDWNSYGAAAMSPRAIKIAREFLKSVAKRLVDKVGERVRPYVVVPLADGGVQIEWRSPERDLEVEIGPDGTLGYLLIERIGAEEKFNEADAVPEEEVLHIVSKVLMS